MLSYTMATLWWWQPYWRATLHRPNTICPPIWPPSPWFSLKSKANSLCILHMLHSLMQSLLRSWHWEKVLGTGCWSRVCSSPSPWMLLRSSASACTRRMCSRCTPRITMWLSGTPRQGAQVVNAWLWVRIFSVSIVEPLNVDTLKCRHILRTLFCVPMQYSGAPQCRYCEMQTPLYWGHFSVSKCNTVEPLNVDTLRALFCTAQVGTTCFLLKITSPQPCFNEYFYNYY